MTDNELLLAISTMMDKKLQPIKDDIQFLKLQNETEILPRLQEIDSCYTSTFNRYKSGITQIEAMQTDIDILKKVVSEHNEKLQKISKKDQSCSFYFYRIGIFYISNSPAAPIIPASLPSSAILSSGSCAFVPPKL